MPADQLPAALTMTSEAFEAAYHFQKPGNDDWVVMQCRTNRRSAWAAQLASDSGMSRCLVYRNVRPCWDHAAVKAKRSCHLGHPCQHTVAKAAGALQGLSRACLQSPVWFLFAGVLWVAATSCRQSVQQL